MISGITLTSFFSDITEWVMAAGVVVGLASAAVALLAHAMRAERLAFLACATWTVGLFASLTGVALGAWIAVIIVAAAGILAFSFAPTVRRLLRRDRAAANLAD